NPVSLTARAAPSVLAARRGHATAWALVEQTTATAGATTSIFARCAGCGLRCPPRWRASGRRRLERSGASARHHSPPRPPQSTGRRNRHRVLEGWEERRRAAGSRTRGQVPASLWVHKRPASPPPNARAQALQASGRLGRTVPGRRWYANKEERRRGMRPRHQGEARHALRAALRGANKGHLRRQRGDALGPPARGLPLVTHAVSVWHTVYRAAAVAQLTREGDAVPERALAPLWPPWYAHMHV